jgi:hypothetical protein
MRTRQTVHRLEYERARDNFMFMSGESNIIMIWRQLKPAIRTKRGGFLSSSLCLQHDKAWPHAVCHTVKQIQDLNPEVLPQPPYLLKLAPWDFHFFWPP